MKPATTIAPDARPRVRARRNLPAVVADFDGRAKRSPTVGRFAQDVIANLLVIDLAVDHINSFAAVCESNSQLAAFTQPFADGIIFRQRFAVGADSHQVKLARFRIVETPVDPGDERIAVWRKFYDWKARRILHFVESTRGGEAAFAVIHCKANIGPRLVTFFAGNRPNDIGAVIGAESYLGPFSSPWIASFTLFTRLAADQVFPLSDDAASSASRTGEGAILPDW